MKKIYNGVIRHAIVSWLLLIPLGIYGNLYPSSAVASNWTIALTAILTPAIVAGYTLRTEIKSRVLKWWSTRVELRMGMPAGSRLRYLAYLEYTGERLSYLSWAQLKDVYLPHVAGTIDLLIFPDVVESITLRGDNMTTITLGAKLPNLKLLDVDNMRLAGSVLFCELPKLSTFRCRSGSVNTLDFKDCSKRLTQIQVSGTKIESMIIPKYHYIPACDMEDAYIRKIKWV